MVVKKVARKLYLMVAFTIFIFSCTKNKSQLQPTATTCRVSGIKLYDSDTLDNYQYYYLYNDSGLLTQITFVVRRFREYDIYIRYGAGYILEDLVYPNSGLSSNHDSLVFDSRNRVVYISHGYAPTEISWDKYLYDSLGQMYQHQYYTYGRSYTTADTFGWQNGDLFTYKKDSRLSGSRDIAYSYSDSLYKLGNTSAQIYDMASYGHYLFNSKHLVNKISTSKPGNIPDTSIAYVLDSRGNITDITKTPSAEFSQTKIAYDCK